MAQNTPRSFLTRWLATFALICVYCVSIVGASTLLLTASSTSANARGGGGGGRGGGGRGGGWFPRWRRLPRRWWPRLGPRSRLGLWRPCGWPGLLLELPLGPQDLPVLLI